MVFTASDIPMVAEARADVAGAMVGGFGHKAIMENKVGIGGVGVDGQGGELAFVVDLIYGKNQGSSLFWC